ncbi:hypothetical protein D3C84_750240 [compost metagenome]
MGQPGAECAEGRLIAERQGACLLSIVVVAETDAVVEPVVVGIAPQTGPLAVPVTVVVHIERRRTRAPEINRQGNAQAKLAIRAACIAQRLRGVGVVADIA